MESPVVVDKPPEYHGNAANSNERGFPFDEEEGSGAWSELAARHPDIAARLRQRPATWARKRRPSSQDATDDFGDSFGGFDRFPFDDIPPEFRDHFPSHWNRRFAPRDEQQPQNQAPPQPQSPQQQTTATQTEQNQGHSTQEQQTHLPQYGLRNTVDLGQKSPADPSLVDADDRNQRSMSAPPDNRTANQNCTSKMNSQNQHEQPQQQPPQAEQQSSNVRHIPIFVEGRDEPVINKSANHGAHYGETKPTYAHSPPQQPHIEREQYFSDDVPVNFHHPPNFSRAFGTPFNKGFRQGPQPFVQQKVYPQTAFARGASPQRSQSPKPQMHPEEHYVKVPVHHDHAAPKTEPSRAQQRPPQQQHAQQQQHQPQQQQQHQPQQQQQQQQPHQQQQPSPQQQQDPPQPKPQQTPTNDPITQILSIQTDVLNLMTEVENFTGAKKDKRYLFLDEMLTRNLIKLDNIETDGKENIRQARKEAIRCIQKCIAVLEAKAEKGNAESQPQDVDMKENAQNEQPVEEKPAVENGEVEMKEAAKEEKVEPQTEPQPAQPQPQEEKKEEQKPQEEKKDEAQSQEINKEAVQPQAADTQPEEKTSDVKQEEQKSQENVQKKKDGPKKGAKNVKKRDKSKDNNNKEATKDSNKDEKVEDKKSEDKKEQKKVEDKKEDKKIEDMQVDEKGDKTDSQTMDVDGASASQ